MKAIETGYKGYRFRSRAEARWAVFLDSLGYDWLYEHEGFVLPDQTPYLPDFYFPKLDVFAEVKGTDFTKEEEKKCRQLSLNDSMVILLDGPPDEKSYRTYRYGKEFNEVIFMPFGDEMHPFYYCCEFDKKFCDGTMEAINKSRSARFEHGETV